LLFELVFFTLVDTSVLVCHQFCNAVEEETNNLEAFLFTIEIYACFCLFQLVQASPEVKERRGEER
jgi:hypothetical protein